MSFAHILTVTKRCHLEANLPAWEKSLLPFNLKADVEFFVWRPEKKNLTEAGMQYSAVGKAGP